VIKNEMEDSKGLKRFLKIPKLKRAQKINMNIM
jgi:hypothetical protein